MPAKKKAAKKHRKSLDDAISLNRRQATYVKGLAQGKTKKDAAIEAGYSESTAENAAQCIEGLNVRAAFQAIIRRRISPEKIATRIQEGLDAMETKFANFEGMITDSRDVIAWEERRKYAELASKYGGYYIDKSEVDLNDTRDNAGQRLAELLATAVERAGKAPDASGTK